MFDKQSSPNGIIRSEDHLTGDYTAEPPVDRDYEIEQIAEALRPLAQRDPPNHLLIHGPTGTGKTTCIKHVLDRLDEETRIRTVYINCWQYNTRPSLLTELLIQLGYPAPRKGKPVDELLSKLMEWLDKNRGVAVVLDEFDQLDDRTEVIYDLQLLNEEADHPLGIVMVSNQPPDALQLGPRSQSRINYQILEFQPYSTTQLIEILERRVEQAFEPGTVDDTVIETIAERVAQQDGDCRHTLELLLRAGRKAEQKGTQEITPDLLDEGDA